MATMLRLPPEQGGQMFGPFTGIVQIGTDSRRTQVQLDPRHGIYPIHATLALTATGTHQFAPAQMEAKCFVAQQGTSQVWPVTGAVEVKAGDAIILGTPGGPRFELVESAAVGGPVSGPGMAGLAAGGMFAGGGMLAMLGKMMQPQQHRRRPQGLGAGIMDEIMRRGQRQIFRGPMRQWYYLYHRARTGSLINPYTIVSALLAMVGMFSAGAISCLGGFVALWAKMF